MNAQNYIILIVCMGLVTYLPRMLPLAILSRYKIPSWLAEWLEMIPPAILCAMIAPHLFTNYGQRTLQLWKPELLAAAPTIVVALKTRSIAISVIVGMLCYCGLRMVPALMP